MHGNITDEFVVMDTAIAHNDPNVAELFEDLGPAPDAADGGVAVSGQARLGNVEAGASPVIGNQNQPEPVWAGFERWPVGVFPTKDTVGKFGIGLNLNGGRRGRNGGSFGSHRESFPPAARRKFGAQPP